jgi:hypothetical protein
MIEEAVNRACRELTVHVKTVAATFAAASQSVGMPGVEVITHLQESWEDETEKGDDGSEILEQLRTHLQQQHGVINSILKHLTRAAKIAKSAEESHAKEPFECIIDVFMEDYYDLMDPQGIAERRSSNWRIESEQCNVEVNFLGSLLVHDASSYLARIQNAPAHLHDELACLAQSGSSITASNWASSEEEYHDLFWSHNDAAFSWQSHFSDEMLLRALDTLRAYVIATGFFTEL